MELRQRITNAASSRVANLFNQHKIDGTVIQDPQTLEALAQEEARKYYQSADAQQIIEDMYQKEFLTYYYQDIRERGIRSYGEEIARGMHTNITEEP